MSIYSISKGVHIGVEGSIEGSPEEKGRIQDWDVGTGNSYIEANWRHLHVEDILKTLIFSSK